MISFWYTSKEIFTYDLYSGHIDYRPGTRFQ